MADGEDNTEGSWIPSFCVSILILLWWISQSQSPRALRIRRWCSTKVCQSNVLFKFVVLSSRGIELEVLPINGHESLTIDLIFLMWSQKSRLKLYSPYRPNTSLQPFVEWIFLRWHDIEFRNGSIRLDWNDHFRSILLHTFIWFYSSSQRVQLKKQLGLRDESIYRDGAAGDGANQKHKRQGWRMNWIYIHGWNNDCLIAQTFTKPNQNSAPIFSFKPRNWLRPGYSRNWTTSIVFNVIFP